MRCQGMINKARPSRGRQQRCPYRAQFYIPEFNVRVCGYHTWAYKNFTEIQRMRFGEIAPDLEEA